MFVIYVSSSHTLTFFIHLQAPFIVVIAVGSFVTSNDVGHSAEISCSYLAVNEYSVEYELSPIVITGTALYLVLYPSAFIVPLFEIVNFIVYTFLEKYTLTLLEPSPLRTTSVSYSLNEK